MTAAFLGLDTSYYTTSVALVDSAGRVLADARRPLSVPGGERGVQPSRAVFAHVTALPALIEQVLGPHRAQVRAVAASAAPRPLAGSYLPVFKVCEGFGHALAAALAVPFVPTTHQEGHVMAGLWSAGGPAARRFLAVHLSGGTTELLLVQRSAAGFAEERLGGGRDLHVGQFVDRVGVALGLPFPAGPHLEKLALSGRPGRVTLPSAVQGLEVSFAGPASQAQRLLGEVAPADLALATFHCIARTLEKWLRGAAAATGIGDVLLVGGVAANSLIRARLVARLKGSHLGLYFTEPAYCTDNAVGVALLARAFTATENTNKNTMERNGADDRTDH